MVVDAGHTISALLPLRRLYHILVRLSRPIVRNNVLPGRSRLEQIEQNVTRNDDAAFVVDAFFQTKSASSFRS